VEAQAQAFKTTESCVVKVCACLWACVSLSGVFFLCTRIQYARNMLRLKFRHLGIPNHAWSRCVLVCACISLLGVCFLCTPMRTDGGSRTLNVGQAFLGLAKPFIRMPMVCIHFFGRVFGRGTFTVLRLLSDGVGQVLSILQIRLVPSNPASDCHFCCLKTHPRRTTSYGTLSQCFEGGPQLHR